jgi:hypothetical protein
VAVDDGASSTIRALRLKAELYSPLEQDQVVTATLTRNLRHVRAIRPVALSTDAEATPAPAASG